MEFRIADTFADSLARLTHDKQKLVKTTAFDLQMNPASPGLSFHKLDRGKGKNFCLVRVGSDIRLIVHRSESSLLLCYVDHHDSWKSLGVDVRGRSRTLRVNYRTSHQIRSQADRLLGPSVTDVDGNTEDRSDTVSVFNGPPPRIQILDGADEEIAVVGRWLAEGVRAGTLPHEIGVFVRSEAQIGRAEEALRLADLPFHVLDDRVATEHDHVSVSTMPLAKGLEFRAVVVMACDDEVIPLQERIETVGDDGDLQEVYDTERQLLYVACTRARDRLLVTGTAPSSEFLDDLEGK